MKDSPASVTELTYIKYYDFMMTTPYNVIIITYIINKKCN